MRPLRAIATLVLLVLGACSSPNNRLPSYSLEQPQLESLALELPSYPTGNTQSLRTLRGKVVVLDVWATWCKPCRESLPELQALAEEHPDHLEVITVNIDDDEQALPGFLAELKLELPVWRDPGAKTLATQLRFTQAPTSYILDKHGVVRSALAGYSETTSKQQQDLVAQLLRE